MTSRTVKPPISYLGIGHRSHDVHVRPGGSRSDPEPGGAAMFTALTARRITGQHAAIVTSSPSPIDASNLPDGLEVHAVQGEGQTVFEDWIVGDVRRQRLVSRAGPIPGLPVESSERIKTAQTVFACPLLDELPFDCRTWFNSGFACLIPQGWFRRIASDQSVMLAEPDVRKVAGSWDLVVLSEGEAAVVSDLGAWRSITRLLAITLGSRGAMVIDEAGSEHAIPPVEIVDVADQTGAGDVWSAAFTVRFLECEDISESGSFAAAAAAICVSRPGLNGVPQSRDEVEEMRRASRQRP